MIFYYLCTKLRVLFSFANIRVSRTHILKEILVNTRDTKLCRQQREVVRNYGNENVRALNKAKPSTEIT
jgi:hypothetical protein